MTVCAERELLLHGLLDGELDAANALACEAHLRTCPGCAAEMDRLRALRSALNGAGLGYRAPDALRRRIEGALDAATAAPPAPSRPWRRRGRTAGPWALGALAGAMAASLALTLAPRPQSALETELVADHVRSLLAAHLTDVATSDRHVVKPWFNGRIDFAPPVIELADRGFPLAGGRLDYVRGKVVAALVYRRRQHVINLFVWPERDRPAGSGARRLQGYSLAWWSSGGLEFWAVSDVEPTDLAAFRQAFAARAPG